MATKENLTPLKILVFSMGIVLIAGSALIAGVVVKNFSSKPVACDDGSTYNSINVMGGGRVIETRVEGLLAQVTFQRQPGQREVTTFDVCTKRPVSSVLIVSDAPGQSAAPAQAAPAAQ